MSLYGAYIKEREDFEIYEDCFGFATYQIVGEYCYIRDIYVVPERRKDGIASKYADAIAEIAKEKGASYLIGSVFADDSATASMEILLAYGFKFKSIENNLIFFKKRIN